MTILDCCITLIKKNLVVLGVVDMRQLLLNEEALESTSIFSIFILFSQRKVAKCMNGGICTPFFRSYVCKCKADFIGPKCENSK